jgi:hypothetical protein
MRYAASGFKRLKQFKDENSNLKKLISDLMLDKFMLYII